MLPVHIYPSLAHGPVKKEHRPAPMRHAEYSTVPSDADIRKPSSPAGLHGSLILEVLGDSHCLQVIADIERPVYSPVMRDSDFLPRRIIESRRG